MYFELFFMKFTRYTQNEEKKTFVSYFYDFEFRDCFLLQIFFLSFCGQSVEAYWWRVCYQQGLPRLVFLNFIIVSWFNFLCTNLSDIDIIKIKKKSFHVSTMFICLVVSCSNTFLM